MKLFDEYDDPKYWDTMASKILNQNTGYSDVINQYLIDRKVSIISKLIETFEPHSVIETGCGSGAILIPLAQKYNGIDFVGIDFSVENIKNLRDECLDKCISSKIIAQISDVSRIYYTDKSFDLLYSFDVLCHLKFDKLHKAINEFHRVAKKSYYSFHGLEWTSLPYYHYLFSKFFPQKIADKITLRYTKKLEESKMPEMRGLCDDINIS